MVSEACKPSFHELDQGRLPLAEEVCGRGGWRKSHQQGQQSPLYTCVVCLKSNASKMLVQFGSPTSQCPRYKPIAGLACIYWLHKRQSGRTYSWHEERDTAVYMAIPH